VRGELPRLQGKSIAYFSAEFALHQSLPIYAGGLGVLAGDHCKEASDLGVPLVGVGFMYPQGYFHQASRPTAGRQEIYEKLNWTDAPIEPAIDADGKPCVTAVPLGNRTVLVAVWRVRVGRVTLYLLDTDLEENAPWDRELSARLYGGDRETRVQQEIVLGIGGVRALQGDRRHAGGLSPQRRHAAFVVLQRIRDLCEQGELRRGARGRAAHHGLHDAHAGAGRARRVSVPPRSRPPRRRLGRPRRVIANGSSRSGTTTTAAAAVQHDRAGAAHQRRGERRQPAARRSHQADVAVDLAGQPYERCR
jgi:hypothetical protein